MIRACYRGVVASWLLIGVGTGVVQAAAWTDALFPENRHDFGPVPRGVKVKHDFLLVNRLAEPITILNLRPSCGCTSGRASASIVAPGQTAVIEAQMDTRNFVGLKSTVLYVALMTAGGREAEAGLGVSAQILSDIVLNPGSIDFGTVLRGRSPSQVLTIDRINGEGWRFQRMVSASRALNAQLVETGRKGGAVSYALTVSLKPDAPAGSLRDEIRLISNDPETPSIPILVTARVRGDLTAAPSILALGQLNSSAGVQGRFIIRGSRPFTIQSIEGDGDGFSTTAARGARQAVHIVTVAYKPEEGTTRGDIRRVFRVHTDLPGEPPVDLTATLHVDP
ncbi:MAG TPA: DUF1573 domain-containing protein [Isosphaeraceae bacterium]|nr:DUF1573 domain-containing protein [Isosphaeraceae bacterium]